MFPDPVGPAHIIAFAGAGPHHVRCCGHTLNEWLEEALMSDAMTAVQPTARASRARLRLWPGRRAEPLGLCLVVPGLGYTASMPLLFWPATALTEAGWAVVALEWDEPPGSLEELESQAHWTRSASKRMTGRESPMMIVGKSLGTRLAPWAEREAIPAAWLTPVLDDEAVLTTLELGKAPALVAGGTADPAWRGGPRPRMDLEVLEFPQADHSLLITGDWQRSMRIQNRITSRILDLAARVVARG